MTTRTNMLSDSAIYSTRIYFAYSQFQVFDKAALPGHHWTQGHFDQGFARTERSVSFGTPLEFGHGAVLVHLGPYEGRDGHIRVVEVPFEVSSGEVVVGGPEEFPVKLERVFQLPKGHYRLVAAQAVTDEDQEDIDIYIQKLGEPLTKSRVLVADGAMKPPTPLLESAEDPQRMGVHARVCRLAALLIVPLPLRAVAATVPVLFVSHPRAVS